MIVEKSNAVVPELLLQRPVSSEVALHVVHGHDDIGEEPHELALRISGSTSSRVLVFEMR